MPSSNIFQFNSALSKDNVWFYPWSISIPVVSILRFVETKLFHCQRTAPQKHTTHHEWRKCEQSSSSKLYRTKQRMKNIGLFLKWVRNRTDNKVCGRTHFCQKILFHWNRLLLNALISKEDCFSNKAGTKNFFLNLLSLSPPGAWLQAHSSGDGACSERKEVESHKPDSLATMPGMTLSCTHSLYNRSLMKTNWRGKGSQLAFIKTTPCQNKVMTLLCLGNPLEGEGGSTSNGLL